MSKTYGVTTTERAVKNPEYKNSMGGILNVEIIDARLNIGNGLSDRSECNEEELWVAARKLNAADEILAALERTLDELVGGREAINRDSAIAQARSAIAKAKCQA